MTLRSHLATSSKTRRGYHRRRRSSATQLTPPFSAPTKSTGEFPVSPPPTVADDPSFAPAASAAEATDDTDLAMEDLTAHRKSSSFSSRSSRSSSGSSQRRSSFMGSSMRKERIQFHETGLLDCNGQPTYVLRVTEAQGFRWNPLLYDLHDHSPLYDDAYD